MVQFFYEKVADFFVDLTIPNTLSLWSSIEICCRFYVRKFLCSLINYLLELILMYDYFLISVDFCLQVLKLLFLYPNLLIALFLQLFTIYLFLCYSGNLTNVARCMNDFSCCIGYFKPSQIFLILFLDSFKCLFSLLNLHNYLLVEYFCDFSLLCLLVVSHLFICWLSLIRISLIS